MEKYAKKKDGQENLENEEGVSENPAQAKVKAKAPNPMDMEINPDEFFALSETEVVDYGLTNPLKLTNENPDYAYQWVAEEEVDLYISRKWLPVKVENSFGLGGKPVSCHFAMKGEQYIKLPKRRPEGVNMVLIVTSKARRQAIDNAMSKRSEALVRGANEEYVLSATNKEGERSDSKAYNRLEDEKIK